MSKPSIVPKLALVVGTCLIAALAGTAVAQDEFGLPNPAQVAFLESLAEDAAPPAIATVEVAAPPGDWPYLTSFDLGREETPVRALQQVVIKLTSDATPEEISALIERHQLQVVDRLPPIGMLVARVPITPGDVLERELGLRGDVVDEAVRALEGDGVVLSVTANTVLSPNMLRDAYIPEPFMEVAAAAEEVDWGIGQAHIADAWPLLNGAAFRVGVIDVGFASHEDLASQQGLPLTIPSHDHGNHVSGIICALHNDLGVKGVVPNCTTVIATSVPILDDIEGQGVQGFYTLFSELLATVVEFIVANPDVKVINLSLGYNWFPNFQINPIDHPDIRDLVRAQGVFFVSVLKLAAAHDIAIVSAAGNDSSNQPVPHQARWASPFNWAAVRVAELDGWTNGVVVEAHDQTGSRAVFSNVDGHISAPGVKILSTLAANNGYGRLSGTSMASPYVTGALTLLRAVTPNRTLREHIACLVSGSSLSTSGTVMLDLQAAIDSCD